MRLVARYRGQLQELYGGLSYEKPQSALRAFTTGTSTTGTSTTGTSMRFFSGTFFCALETYAFPLSGAKKTLKYNRNVICNAP
jgi:hypothetical protein